MRQGRGGERGEWRRECGWGEKVDNVAEKTKRSDTHTHAHTDLLINRSYTPTVNGARINYTKMVLGLIISIYSITSEWLRLTRDHLDLADCWR